jgi:hypothetical protein
MRLGGVGNRNSGSGFWVFFSLLSLLALSNSSLVASMALCENAIFSVMIGSKTHNERKIPVGILGATGTVGQKFIKLLEDNPWFEVTEVAASERTSGKLYGDAVSWNRQ